tara:strand:- start:1234 stop:1830 length:597 start_codon:yes stop_codon:yes gene_type:complete
MSDIILFLKNLNLTWTEIELAAVIFSIIYVILAAKKNTYCWFAAVISVSLYIYICFNAKLYAETGLQIFYLIMAFYGYYHWKKEDNLKINSWSINKHIIIILLGTLLTFFIGFYFSTYTQANMPIIDSFTTVFSIIATYMVAKKILENWIYWIVIDITSIYLYWHKDLHLSSILFLIYTIIAIFGYINWLKKETKYNE